MCSNENYSFFKFVSKEFGEGCKKSLKDWINHKLRICRVKQQLRFLIRCRSCDLLPPHIYKLRINVSLKDFRVNRRYENSKNEFLRKLLNLEIKDIHVEFNHLMASLTNIEKTLSSMLPGDVLGNFYDSNSNRIRRYNLSSKRILIKKFNKIKLVQNTDYKNLFNFDNSKWVVNNYSKIIPEPVKKFVSLGDKFALPLNVKDSKDKIDTTFAFVKNFEASCHKIPEKVVDKVRSSFVNSLKKNLNSNKYLNYIDTQIYKEYVKCKKFLKNNDDIFVTRADKGQVTVLMDKNVYIKQMEEILKDDSTYRPLSKNPLRKMTTKLDGMIKAWFDMKIIEEWQYKKLKCTNGNLPRCYGLPKIHKPGYPLRIIVSSLGSPLYEIAKFLNSILNASLNRPLSHIKDCWSFVNCVKGITVELNEILVSLDATSLFTNIPKELVVRAIENRWNLIQKNTKLSLA